MRRTSQRTALIGRPSAWATLCCTSVGCCVEECTMHLAAVLRQRQRRLTFEVEMLLPAHLDHALDSRQRRRGQRRGGSRPTSQMRGPSSNRLLAASACIDGQDRRQFVDTRPGPAAPHGGRRDGCRPPPGTPAGRGNAPRRWPAAARHGSRASNRASAAKSAADQTATTPGAARTADKVHAGDPAMGDRGQAEGQMQAVGGHRDVVDIAGAAGDMQRRGIMRQRFGDAHGVTSSTRAAMP